MCTGMSKVLDEQIVIAVQCKKGLLFTASFVAQLRPPQKRVQATAGTHYHTQSPGHVLCHHRRRVRPKYWLKLDWYYICSSQPVSLDR